MRQQGRMPQVRRSFELPSRSRALGTIWPHRKRRSRSGLTIWNTGTCEIGWEAGIRTRRKACLQVGDGARLLVLSALLTDRYGVLLRALPSPPVLPFLPSSWRHFGDGKGPPWRTELAMRRPSWSAAACGNGRIHLDITYRSDVSRRARTQLNIGRYSTYGSWR